MEPVQNAGGCFVPPEGYFERVREICDQYDVLLISDEVICAYGRLGYVFGASATATSPTSSRRPRASRRPYAPMGAVIASDKVIEPFLEGTNSFAHGFTCGGHPMCAAVALANLDVFESEGLLEHVRENEDAFRGHARVAARHRDRRRRARHRATSTRSSSSRTARRASRSSTRSPSRCCAASCRRELYRRGLICRADDRGDPVVQLSPPLIAGPEHFEEIESVLRPVLEEASRRMLHA